MLSSPVNLPKWYVDLRKLCGSAGFGKMIDSRQARRKNSHLLQPPINNYCVYNEGFTVMVSS